VNNGGPAFPQSIAFNPNGDAVTAAAYFDGEGMSLRDYFATQALIAVFTAPPMTFHASSKEEAVAIAYEIADVMLETRKVKT